MTTRASARSSKWPTSTATSCPTSSLRTRRGSSSSSSSASDVVSWSFPSAVREDRMSFSFYIRAPDPPDYQTILDGLDFWDVHCEEGEAEDAPREGGWPEGALHFYRDAV